MKTVLERQACRGALIGLLAAGFVASAGERVAAFEASGWKGVEIGTEYGAAKEAFAKAGVVFEEKSLHKTGTKLLSPTRDGWDMNTVYFDWNEKTRKDNVSQILFIKEKTDEAGAAAVVADLTARYGAPAEVKGPITIQGSEQKETWHIWKNAKTELKLTVSVRKDGTVAVFENWGRP